MAGGHPQKTVHEQHSEKYFRITIMYGSSKHGKQFLLKGAHTFICNFFLQIPVTFEGMRGWL
jgi:hypothetical protein